MSSPTLESLREEYRRILTTPNVPDTEEKLFSLAVPDTQNRWWFINPNNGSLFCYDPETSFSSPASPDDFIPADPEEASRPSVEVLRNSLLPPPPPSPVYSPEMPNKKSQSKEHYELVLLGILLLSFFGVLYFRFIKTNNSSPLSSAPTSTQVISPKVTSVPSIGTLNSATLTLTNPQNSALLSQERYTYNFVTKQAYIVRTVRSGTAKGTYRYYTPNYTKPQAYASTSKTSYWVPLQAPLSYSSGSYRSGTLDWLAAILTAANKVQLTPATTPNQKTLSVIVNGHPSIFTFTFSHQLLSQVSFEVTGYKPLIYSATSLNLPTTFPRVTTANNQVINP